MFKRLILAAACAMLATWTRLPPAAAQESPPAQEDPAHNELRALKKQLTDAVNANDLDALLAVLDENVVVTWQNAEVSRGPQQVREYYDRMMKGDKRIVQSITINPTVDELTHLYGDTGVASGSSKDHFKLTDGRDFEFDSRWTATIVKKNGQWKLAAFHASTNTFDNPVMWIAVKSAATWAGVIAGVLGLVVGFGAGRFFRKPIPKAS